MKQIEKQQKHFEAKKARRLRNLILAAWLIGAVALVLTAPISKKAWIKSRTPPPETRSAEVENELEQYMISSTTTNEILPGLTPVLIYRYDPRTESASVAGSGGMFEGANGKQVVTAAHVFMNSGGPDHYCVRKLRPLEGHRLEYGIESIVPAEQNIPGYGTAGNDAVLCRLGGLAPSIAPFYTDEREKAENFGTWTMVPLDQATRIRSVRSGEEVPIIGVGSQSPNGMTYYLIKQKTRPGESGTVYADAQKNIYVLKGSADQSFRMSADPAMIAKLGYPPDAPLSVIVGPFARAN
ncbi:MAG: hypothetical protein JWO73_16 [Candidatus Taylorbacteria bacterium]|nr:hypothetical protein [Candidatus Taylorbacteria bacterium]